MLDGNTNKVTWIGVAIGIVALLGVGSTTLFPEAFDTAKSQIVKTATGFADGKSTQNGGKSKSVDMPDKPINVGEKDLFVVPKAPESSTKPADTKPVSGGTTSTPKAEPAPAPKPAPVATPQVPKVTEIVDDYATTNFKYKNFSTYAKSVMISGYESASKLPKDLVIPAKVKKDGVVYTVVLIKGSAFSYLDLNSVRIPGTVQQIDDSAFYGTRIANSLEIANGVQSIGARAFDVDTGSFTRSSSRGGLKTVVIPKSVTHIGERAFRRAFNSWDYNDATLYLPKTLKDVGENLTSSVDTFEVDPSVNSVNIVRY